MSLAKRLKSAQSMRLVLYEELSAIEQARAAALSGLTRLAEQTAKLEPAFVEQVCRDPWFPASLYTLYPKP